MHKVEVQLGERSYPIQIAASFTGLLPELAAAPQVVIISNPTVAELYLPAVAALFQHSPKHFLIPDGEAYKTLASFEQALSFLLEQKLSRQVLLVALGGGVIGDLTGFVAACYQRGVRFVQIPTTLLSQVDSSVGGKTGINHPLGKNMIGAFHQPKAVIIDTESLNTLPDSELSAGLAEVIKYGLIRDINFFSWLEINIKNLLDRKPEYLKEAIVRSCQNKASVVAEDEFETDKGIRAMLNLGHTFGHAIEAALGYGVWLHGQAVAVGIVMAAFVSMRHGWLNIKDFNRIKQIFLNAKLPTNPPDISKELFLDLMGSDKKNKDGKINLVLIKKIGQAFLTKDFSNEILSETLNKKIF